MLANSDGQLKKLSRKKNLMILSMIVSVGIIPLCYSFTENQKSTEKVDTQSNVDPSRHVFFVLIVILDVIII